MACEQAVREKEVSWNFPLDNPHTLGNYILTERVLFLRSEISSPQAAAGADRISSPGAVLSRIILQLDGGSVIAVDAATTSLGGPVRSDDGRGEVEEEGRGSIAEQDGP